MFAIVRNPVSVLLSLVWAASAVGAQLPPPDVGQGTMRDMGAASTPISESEEIALGRELAGRFLGAYPLVDDRQVQLYVNRVGRRIARESARPDLPWRFGVVESSALNAHSAPGGYVFISRGLYAVLDDEAQLAGALAHAIAAIEGYHHIQLARPSAAMSAMARVAHDMASQRGSPNAGAIATGSEFFANMIDKSYVLEADRTAVSLASRAGYAPYGLVDVIHKCRMVRADPATTSFTTHPPYGERLQALGKVLEPMLDADLASTAPPPQRLAPLR